MFILGGFIVVAIAIRVVVRRFSYRPSSITWVGDILLVTLARDAFRDPEKLAATTKLFNRVRDSGYNRVIVDLSSIELGFYDHDVFGILGALYHQFYREGSWRLALVRPGESVYNSFEFRLFRGFSNHGPKSLPLVDSVEAGLQFLEDSD